MGEGLVVLILVVCWFAFVFVVVAMLLYGKAALSFVDQTRCATDGEQMKPDGSIAHDFKRHYVCPLCTWDTYVADSDLKRQKQEQIRQDGRQTGEEG